MAEQTIRYTKGTFPKVETLRIDQSRGYRGSRDVDHDGKLTARDPSPMVPYVARSVTSTSVENGGEGGRSHYRGVSARIVSSASWRPVA